MGSHHITNQAIRVDGDTHGPRVVLPGFMVLNECGHERTLQIGGRYLDHLERQKLLGGYYAGAIPFDLLRTEQDRISADLRVTTERLAARDDHFDTVSTNLDHARELAGNWHVAHLVARPTERRQLNQAIFDGLYITDDDQVRHDFAEPFALLLGRGPGTRQSLLVGAEGLEPPTPSL